MRKIILIITLIIVMGMNTIVLSDYKKSEIHFLNVGQGDCILIKGYSKNYLIDTGAEYYTRRVLRYLNVNRVNNIDGIILTHYHNDHYDGMTKIVQCKKVEKVYLPRGENSVGKLLKNKLNAMKISVEYIGQGWRLRSKDIDLQAIAPLYKNNTIENNNSIVLQGSIGSVNYLFAGDCEKNEEQSMINSGKLKKCDVLKVPHHGLNTSTQVKLLEKIHPKVAIITSNKNTPNKVVENRLINKGITVWKTNNQGNIFIKNKTLYCDKNYTSIKLK